MELEQRLRRVEPPKLRTKIRRTIYGVRVLYMEDLIAIYKEVEKTQQPAFEQQRRDQDQWELTNELLKRDAQRIAKAAKLVPMPASYTHSPITMRNEEFEFDSLDDVEQIKRKGFSEFNINGSHGWFRFHIDGAWAYIESEHDDAVTEGAVEAMLRTLKRRQSRVIALVCRRDFLTAWATLVLLGQVTRIFWEDVIVGGVTALLTWTGIITAVWYFAVWSNRKRVVVPRFEDEVAKTFWESHQGIIGVVIGLAALLITFFAWWFPRG